MRFRLKAFGLHLLASAAVLSVALGTLFLGWYRWPGWYLTDVFTISAMLAGIDLMLGPLLTLLIANPKKPRRELGRDIAVIAAAQLLALSYGAATLWNGRPLYYAFSVNRLETVRAFEIEPREAELGRAQNPKLAPHWYSRPRWIWAPLPSDAAAANAIVDSAMAGGSDVVDMPRLFKSWEDGLPSLRASLRRASDLPNLGPKQLAPLKERIRRRGYSPDDKIFMIMTGRSDPLAVVFDPTSGAILDYIPTRLD